MRRALHQERKSHLPKPSNQRTFLGVLFFWRIRPTDPLSNCFLRFSVCLVLVFLSLSSVAYLNKALFPSRLPCDGKKKVEENFGLIEHGFPDACGGGATTYSRSNPDAEATAMAAAAAKTT